MIDALDSVNSIVLLLAGASSLVLAAIALAPRGRGRMHWSFGLGMTGFAVESVVAYVLVTATETPESRLLWLRALLAAGLLVPVPWAVFAASLSYPAGTPWSRLWRISLTAGGALAGGMAVAAAVLPVFMVSDIPGPFYAAQLDSLARYGVIVQLLATVGILAALEARLRTSRGVGRWRVKYLVLGLSGIFLVRFFFLSQLLLFHVVMAVYLTTAAATLILGDLAIAASLARDRLLALELTVSRGVVYRSVVVGVLGLYLFVVGVLGWLLNRLGVAEELFWGSTVVFVSALGLAAVLLSENIRWRVKRVIGRNLYRSKYDYRQQWASFTKRLSSLLTIEELAPQLVAAVCDAVGTAKGALYLLDDRDSAYHLAGAVEVDPPVTVSLADVPLIARLTREHTPVVVGEGAPDGERPVLSVALARVFPEGSAAVPMLWRDILTGFILVGPERTGTSYSTEDLEYLTTVGDQAAGVIMTAHLSEAVARSREFEAFHRLTSFVIHDLKNSISALSLLSQNTLEHADDPEFQRDAAKTLSLTVARMKALLGRLASTPEATALRLQRVALADLAREAIGPLAGSTRVRVGAELAPTPAVAGDPEALLRVLQNLIGNAVEALDGDGVVTVRTYVESGCAVVSVADTGCGIPDEFLRKSLFAPFKSTKKGGWGIGLYQAKAIVEAHRGTIEVASRHGEGTTFWVKLPIDAGQGVDR